MLHEIAPTQVKDLENKPFFTLEFENTWHTYPLPPHQMDR